mmetsp:Transcript_78801/g.163884  ORF Transcript_78801/g.163884 Transcript_78801/m.163884 type:complete len:281 (-) Transcript_78801:28-870(-)
MSAVEVEKSADGQVWTVCFHRPEARNAVNRPTAAALLEAFRNFEKDDTARVAVLYGRGGTFCAGADLKALSSGVGADGLSRNGNRVLKPDVNDPLEEGPMGPTRLRLKKPVLAAIEGHCVAGGLELAVWCDMRICDETAIFGVFCRRWGVPLIDGGTIRLPRLIGQSRAMDMILTGRAVDAKEALNFGLANRVVAKGTARAEAEAIARMIASFPEQACMQADRQSSLEQWGLPSIGHALVNEYELGREVLKRAALGAGRFRDGAGRGGNFKDHGERPSKL